MKQHLKTFFHTAIVMSVALTGGFFGPVFSTWKVGIHFISFLSSGFSSAFSLFFLPLEVSWKSSLRLLIKVDWPNTSCRIMGPKTGFYYFIFSFQSFKVSIVPSTVFNLTVFTGNFKALFLELFSNPPNTLSQAFNRIGGCGPEVPNVFSAPSVVTTFASTSYSSVEHAKSFRSFSWNGEAFSAICSHDL